jgi:ribosomal protein S18 acetylase RimI-like enzyme
MLQETRQINLREAEDSEREDVAEVIRRAYSQFKSQYNQEHWVDYERSTRLIVLNDPDVSRLVAIVEDRIAAAVLFCPPYEKTMAGHLVKNPYPEFRLLGVDPDFRDMGIGNLLILECERRALEAGYKTMSLHTTELMQTAKSMYERRGYQRFVDIDFSPAPNFVVMGYKRDLV